MSDFPHSSTADEREAQVRARQQKERSRFFVAYAMVEGFLLAAAVVVVYVLELIDPAQGVWLLVAIAVLGGGVLSAYLVTGSTRNQRELEQARRLG